MGLTLPSPGDRLKLMATKQQSMFPAEAEPEALPTVDIVIDGRRTLLQHNHDIPPPRGAAFFEDWQARGRGAWVLSCELVVETEAEARQWVEHGIEPGDDRDS